MSNKVICFALCAMLFALSFPAQAQQAGMMPRIGYLNNKTDPNARDEAFLQGLRDLGWIEGKNIAFEYRWAAGKRHLYPAIAKEVVRLKVDLIVTATRGMARAAKNATTTIPIVMVTGSDAVENGLVASLAHPGGNITGMSEPFSEIYTKLLGVLHETLPKVKRVVFLHRLKKSQTMVRTLRKLQAVAPQLGLMFHSEQFEIALEATAQERSGALMVGGAAYRSFGRRLAAFAAKNRLPVFSMSGPVKKHFGLLTYGPDFIAMYRGAATHVDKILRGAKPADLPVELPHKYKLTINLKTAKALGITIPPSVLYRADKVIK